MLRFRVWDHEHNTMIPPSDVWISFVFFAGNPVPDAYLFDQKKKRWKPIPLRDVMQSVPHPECSEREIFEGDIVEIGGRRGIFNCLDGYILVDRYAVPQPEILSLPGSRVLVIGNMGKRPGPGLARAVREWWQVQRN